MPKKEVLIPALGESVSEATFEKIIAPEGSYVNEDDPIVELGSEKASVEVPAVASGVISYSANVGDTLKVDDVIAHIDTDAKKEEKAPPAPEEKREESVSKPVEKVKSVQEAPKDKIDEDSTGVRISPDEHLESLTREKPSVKEPKKIQVAEEKIVEQRREPMTRLRKTIAKRLVQVKNETAMLTTFNEVDMSAIMAIRSREKEAFLKKYGAKLTFMPFFIKACISALKEYPDVNAFIDGEDIVYNEGTHIGIAVSTPSGLVVPVMKNADQMTFPQMTQNLVELATKARDRKLSISDMSGGTFTITNGGVFGSMLSTPILNPPQSAILGMHNIVERAVVIDGKIEIRPIMYLALSYDHRIIDGKDSVTFLVHLKNMLEDPTRFLLHE